MPECLGGMQQVVGVPPVLGAVNGLGRQPILETALHDFPPHFKEVVCIAADMGMNTASAARLPEPLGRPAPRSGAAKI